MQSNILDTDIATHLRKMKAMQQMGKGIYMIVEYYRCLRWCVIHSIVGMALYTHVMYMYMVCCASLTLLIQHVAIVVHTCMCYKSIETQESEGNYLHYISYCSSTDILLHSKVACTQTHCSEYYDPLKGRNHTKDF